MTNYRAVAAQDALKILGKQYVQGFLRQINQESGFNPNARSGAGAQGIAQFMPATAREYGVNTADPLSSLLGAARYDKKLIDQYGSFARALSAYNSGRPDAYKDPNFAHGQTYNYVRSILGGKDIAAGPSSSPTGDVTAPAAPAPAPQIDTGALRNSALQQLVGLVGASSPDYSAALAGLHELGDAKQQNARAATQPATTPSTPATRQPSAAPPNSGTLKLLGKSITRESPQFLKDLYRAARARGATEIRFISTDRPAAYNKQVGGVAHSNHIPDAQGYAHAADAEAFVPGKGWIPLGTLVAPVAGKYGLRSGDQPGFYRGGRDPNHVDDGANQR